MTRGFDEAEYRALLIEFPPRPIEDDVELARVEARISLVLALAERTQALDAYLTVLSSLVEHWEDAHVNIPYLSGTELIKALLIERGLRQKDLAQIFGTESIVSDVLSGKRELQTKHIAGLADFFHVSPAVFFAPSLPRKAALV